MELPKTVPVGEERKGLLYSAYLAGEEQARSHATGGIAGGKVCRAVGTNG